MPAILAGLAEFAAAALAALEVVAAFLLACAAIYMWIGIARPLFRTVAFFLPGGWKIFGQVIVPDLRGDWLALEGKLYQGLLDWRRGSEIQMAFTWHWMAQAWRWNAGMVQWLAHETDASFEALQRIHMPKWARWLVLGAFPPLLIARLVKAILPHIHAQIVKPIQVIERTLPGKTTTIVRRIGAQAIPDVWHIPGFPGVWHGITRRFWRINWRLSRLEKLLTVAGLAAAIGVVMGVKASCLKRNGNIGQVARRICGLDGGLLSALLAGLVVIEGPISLEEFARELLAIEDELAHLVLSGFTETQGLTT